MDIIYFELNNWFSGCDYPNAEPFLSWMRDDLNQKFRDEEWIKENKLVVVESLVDMSMNFCVTATKEWVENNCPELLYTYENFVRKPEDGEDVPYGRFECPFLEYNEENIGYHYAEEVKYNGYWQYVIDFEEE